MGVGKSVRRLVAVVLCALVAAAGPAEARVLAATPLSRADLPWWAARHAEKVAAAHEGTVKLIWLGDSITQNFEHRGPPDADNYASVWDRFYGDRSAFNLGFSGDATAHVLWRVENGEIAGLHPKLVVLLVGANNLGRLHWGAADTVAGIEAIMAALQARLPGVTVLMIGTLPREGDAWVTDNQRAINRALAAKYGHAPGVIFRDLSGLFERDGAIRHDLYADSLRTPPHPALHPSPEGMALIARAIEPDVARVLGDRVH